MTTTNFPAAPGAGSVESMYMRRVLQKDTRQGAGQEGGGERERERLSGVVLRGVALTVKRRGGGTS